MKYSHKKLEMNRADYPTGRSVLFFVKKAKNARLIGTMPGGRKGFYEELQMKKHLSELTPKVFKHVKEVFDGDDEARKDAMAQKLAPKLIDKGIPTQLTGEEGQAIVIQIAGEIAQKNGITQNPEGDSL